MSVSFLLLRRALNYLLCRAELALLDQRLDVHRAIRDTGHRQYAKRLRSERRSGIFLGGVQVAATQREPAAVGEADVEPATVAGLPCLGGQGIEQRAHLRIALGPKQRERRSWKPRRKREPRPVILARRGAASDLERPRRKVRADVGGLVPQNRAERQCGEQLGRCRRIAGGPLA
jgi:hypothetical protein